MVKRFTVSVPDELAEKIDKWKQEISPSAMFQRAMEEAIEEKEGFAKRITEYETMPEIIERLKREKAEGEKRYYYDGQEAGLAWAKAAPYFKLKYVAQLPEGHLKYPGETRTKAFDACRDDYLGDYFSERFSDDPLMCPDDKKSEVENISGEAEEWLKGWFTAVDAFWKEVSDKI